MAGKFVLEKGSTGKFHFNLHAANGQVIATSGQGYKDKRDCENAIAVIKEGVEKARVEEAKAEEG